MARLADFGFKDGDEVILTADVGMRGFLKAGTTGKICSKYLTRYNHVRVRFDLDQPDGRLHSCDYYCEKGYGFNVLPRDLKLFTNEDTFEITSDDIFALFGGVAV